MKFMWGESQDINESIIRFTTRTDIEGLRGGDYYLFKYEIYANYAYTLMLMDKGILDRDKGLQILNALRDLKDKDPDLSGFEDVHSYVESYLLDHTGYTPHICRSRNDQVILLERMFMRDNLLRIGLALSKLVKGLLRYSKIYKGVIIPLYTHERQADISTYGHLLSSYAYMLLRDLESLIKEYKNFNISPIGAGAISGCTLPIDRSLLSKLLCFDEIQYVTIDVISNRWEFISRYLFLLSHIMLHLSTISRDLIFFSRDEVNALRLPTNTTTGSSAIPHKRNPDPLELIIGKAKKMASILSLSLFLGGESTGYHREYQELKMYMIDASIDAYDSIVIIDYIIHNLEVDEKRFQNLISNRIISSELANQIAYRYKISFRKIHGIIRKYLESSKEVSLKSLSEFLKKNELEIMLDTDISDFLNPKIIASMKKIGGAPGDLPTILKLNRKSLSRIERILNREYEKIRHCLYMLENGV